MNRYEDERRSKLEQRTQLTAQLEAAQEDECAAPQKWGKRACSPDWHTAPTAAQSCTIAGQLYGRMNRSATPVLTTVSGSNAPLITSGLRF